MKIKELRIEKGYTQEELAGLLHVKRATVCMWEKGRSNPNCKTLLLLSRIFQVSVDLILENPIRDGGETGHPVLEKYLSLTGPGRQLVDTLVDGLVCYETSRNSGDYSA